MPSLGTLNVAKPISDVFAWTGGQGLMSCEGVLKTTGAGSVLILETDETGSYQPAGDAILHSSPDKITFFLPAVNVRIRCNLPDALTQCEVFVT
jgi:hypothetical protein